MFETDEFGLPTEASRRAAKEFVERMTAERKAKGIIQVGDLSGEELLDAAYAAKRKLWLERKEQDGNDG